MADQVGMNLDDYVRETLLAVLKGVVQAQQDADVGEFVGRSPTGASTHLNIAKDKDDNTISMVQFDLATTVEDRSERGGKFGIKVIPMLSADAGAKAESASSLVSRLVFSVPISMPKPSAQRVRDREIASQQSAAIREAGRRLA